MAPFGDDITSRFLWNSTAGNPYTLSTKYIASEEDFFIHFLEFTEEEDELLRYKVRIQNFITSNPDITDWERLKREVGKREQYKGTLENVLNRKLENKEFAAYWKKNNTTTWLIMAILRINKLQQQLYCMINDMY